jgi:riboflavin synthase
MFTGIIEVIGVVKSVRKGNRSSEIIISAGKIMEDIKTGDSINTNGVCLTVTSFTGDQFSADIMPESMKRSSLGILKPGHHVNLERAVRLSDRLGGHLVSGHIDDTGTIREIRKDENAVWLKITTEINVLRYIAEKGSVAIDGVSLTVTKVDAGSFDVSIIPFTQTATSLSAKKPGDIVNIECDIIAKYVERLASQKESEEKINMNFLSEHGYI